MNLLLPFNFINNCLLLSFFYFFQYTITFYFTLLNPTICSVPSPLSPFYNVHFYRVQHFIMIQNFKNASNIFDQDFNSRLSYMDQIFYLVFILKISDFKHFHFVIILYLLIFQCYLKPEFSLDEVTLDQLNTFKLHKV
jgi:hypothetical protein